MKLRPSHPFSSSLRDTVKQSDEHDSTETLSGCDESTSIIMHGQGPPAWEPFDEKKYAQQQSTGEAAADDGKHPEKVSAGGKTEDRNQRPACRMTKLTFSHPEESFIEEMSYHDYGLWLL
ncbi:uncharacterized protein ARMOST_02540 [Armillaria ostoyae]|uniref:Uncharacterized protein n=1 Tax=Armillaria ostoyae TaxID=47428 RepID=A0A284QRZ5_ARMOS|nr:uncharacterized protein ARMOST_02540 [Armillaria ostoyae]